MYVMSARISQTLNPSKTDVSVPRPVGAKQKTESRISSGIDRNGGSRVSPGWEIRKRGVAGWALKSACMRRSQVLSRHSTFASVCGPFKSWRHAKVSDAEAGRLPGARDVRAFKFEVELTHALSLGKGRSLWMSELGRCPSARSKRAFNSKPKP